MKFISFASSSKGNSALISYKNTNILVDCGISMKRLTEYLDRYGLKVDDIDCILITHAHFDHISGITTLLKYHDVKILGLKETLSYIAYSLEKNGIKPDLDNFKIIKSINPLNEGSQIIIKDIKVYPLKGCHDVPSLYYKFELGDVKLAILTDMGTYNEAVIRNLSDVHYLMLECNYDGTKLLESDRSEELKARIAGFGGHLSNEDCCEILSKIKDGNLKEVYLAHISDETNSEEYAYEYVANYFKRNSDIEFIDKIFVAKRLEPTVILNDG